MKQNIINSINNLLKTQHIDQLTVIESLRFLNDWYTKFSLDPVIIPQEDSVICLDFNTFILVFYVDKIEFIKEPELLTFGSARELWQYLTK